MRDSQFDDILKNKLNGLTSDQTPDWARFRQEKQIADKAVATPGAIDQSFDAQIKESIDAHKETRVPQWAAFLDKKTTLDNQADFDAQAKAALKKHQTQSPSQWDAFKAYKAKHTAKDSPHPNSGKEITVRPFDTLVKDTLIDFQSTSNPDWAAFLDYKTQHEGVTPAAAQFDLKVKRELESYRAAKAPAWAAFLDVKRKSDIDYDADAPHTEFDAEVSYLTDQVQVTSTPDWSAFKEYRDSQQFDDDINSTLDDYQSDSQPQWDSFLKRKKEKDGVVADVVFDKGIGGTLGRAAAKYNSKHWLMLQARLRRIAALRKGIASYKGLEALFVVLMLFTLSTHMGTLMDGVLSTSETTEEVLPMAEAELAETTVSGGAPIEEKDVETQSKESTTANENTEKSIPVTRTRSQATRKATVSRMRAAAPNTSGSQGSTNNRNNKTTSTGQEPVSQNTSLAAAKKNNTDTDESTIAGPIATALMTQLEDIVSGLDRVNEDRNVRNPIAEEYVDPNIKKTFVDEGHWLHVFGGMEMNLVRTPANPDTGLPANIANPYGYNIEALYSRVKGNVEYELGLGFNAFNYEPFTEFVADELVDYNTATSEREVVFSRTRVKMLSVPMKLKYHFINNGRWSVYTGLGLNHDFIAKIDYEILDTEIRPMSTCPGCPTPPPTTPGLYERTFTTGLFDSGLSVEDFDLATKSNNYILRGSLSLGAERNIGNNVAAYLRADYLPTLYNSDIGPYNNRINKLAVGMGFKFRLRD